MLSEAATSRPMKLAPTTTTRRACSAALAIASASSECAIRGHSAVRSRKWAGAVARRPMPDSPRVVTQDPAILQRRGRAGEIEFNDFSAQPQVDIVALVPGAVTERHPLRLRLACQIVLGTIGSVVGLIWNGADQGQAAVEAKAAQPFRRREARGPAPGDDNLPGRLARSGLPMGLGLCARF